MDENYLDYSGWYTPSESYVDWFNPPTDWLSSPTTYDSPYNSFVDWFNPPTEYLSSPVPYDQQTTSGLLGTVGSLGKGLLDFLGSPAGKSLLGLTSGITSLTTSQPKVATESTKIPQMSPAGAALYDVARSQPLTLPTQTQGLFNQMNLGSLLNTFPAQTWQNAENMIPLTEATRTSALQTKLGQVAPNWASKGTDIQNMIQQVAQEQYLMTQLATQLQQAKAGAQQAANIQAPTQYGNVLGLSAFPQTYTQNMIKSLADILGVAEGRGMIQKGTTGVDQTLMSQISSILAGLAGAKS